MFHESGLAQPIKVKVRDVKILSFIDLRQSECGAANNIVATGSASNAASQGCFAAAEITDKLDDFIPL